MQNTYFFLSFLMFILPYFRERTGILVWRAVVCVFARLRLCSFSSPRFYSEVWINFLSLPDGLRHLVRDPNPYSILLLTVCYV